MPYGLGAAENSDTNVYFSDGSVVPDDYNTTYGGTSGGTYPQVPFSVSPVSWLNQNSTLAIGVAVAFGALLLLAKAGR